MDESRRRHRWPFSPLALALCAAAAAAEPLRVRDAGDRPVASAVVEWLVPPAASWQVAEGVIDQVGKRFQPFVSVVPVGTQVRFPNSDDTRHHVYSFSDARTFELKLYRANDAPPVEFDRAGLVTLGCNVHDNMKAYLVVSEAPWAATSDHAGAVEAPPGSLAAGQALRVWHPRLGKALELQPEPGAEGWTLRLPVEIDATDEQAPRSGSLEERLKRFKRHAG